MKMYRVFLGIGSNVGDRARFLRSAGERLLKLEQVNVIAASSVYETDPVGKTDQPKFLNAVVEIETSLPPPALMHRLKNIEAEMGRTQHERWGPREIDIDILLYDGLVYSDAELHVPHSELARRKFVLVPLREIASDLVHPVSGMTVTELAKACVDSGRVIKTSFTLFI